MTLSDEIDFDSGCFAFNLSLFLSLETDFFSTFVSFTSWSYFWDFKTFGLLLLFFFLDFSDIDLCLLTTDYLLIRGGFDTEGFQVSPFSDPEIIEFALSKSYFACSYISWSEHLAELMATLFS